MNAVLSMLISETFLSGPKSHDHFEAGSAALESVPVGARVDAVAAGDLSVGEWDLLFDAVRERLRLTAGEYPVAQPGAHASDPPGRIHASVLECVEALDQLHGLLRQGRGRRQRLEMDGFDA